MITARLSFEGHEPVASKSGIWTHFLCSHNKNRTVCGLSEASLDKGSATISVKMMGHYYACPDCLRRLTHYETTEATMIKSYSCGLNFRRQCAIANGDDDLTHICGYCTDGDECDQEALLTAIVAHEGNSETTETQENYFVPGCTCYVAVTLPDGTRYLGGIDDCPVHGFGE